MKLTPLEEYFYWEGGREFPNWIVCRASFTGKLVASKLEAAHKKLVFRHPFLHSVVEKSFRGMIWRQVQNFNPVIEWNPPCLANGWPAFKTIDLAVQPGFHLYVREQNNQTHIIFQLDHTICDGKAWELLLVELLNLYAREMGSDVPLIDYDSGTLAGRGNHGKTRSVFKRFFQTLLGASLARHFNAKTVASFLPEKTRQRRDDSFPYPHVISESIRGDDFKLLKQSALKQGVTVNDVCIKELQCAVKDLRRRHGVTDADVPIRVVVPVSLRETSCCHLPACNVISIVTLDRTEAAMEDEKRLLREMHDEMKWIKDNGMSGAFLSLLSLYGLFPSGISRFSKKHKQCRGTVVLSNLLTLFPRSSGALLNACGQLQVEGAVLDDLVITGPLLSGVQISFFVFTYAGNLHVDLNYNAKVLTEQQARDLLDDFVNRLRSHALIE